VLILLLETHRYAQTMEALKTAIHFYPCGQPDTERHDDERLLRMIHYSDCLKLGSFNQSVGKFFGSAYLRSVNIRGANLNSANLSSTDLSGANLNRANLNRANLIGANLNSANLIGADLGMANLIGADLGMANLSGADLSGANLSGADLSMANLSGADLSGADLSRANLSGASLSSANLDCTNLLSANISGASLSGASLYAGDLSGADLSSANLSDANLRRADLSRANLNKIQWNGATHWAGIEGLHASRNVPESLAQIPRFKAAFILSKGMDGGVQGNVLSAIEDYKQAQLIDTGLLIDPDVWDLLCWVGVLHNQARDILFASEKATHSDSDNPVFRDTRGLVRALTGDTQGAIEDFEKVEESIGNNAAFASSYRFVGFGDVNLRRNWLEVLRFGLNPFTPKIFEAMRKQAGIGCDGEAEEAVVISGVLSDYFPPNLFPGKMGQLPGIRRGGRWYGHIG
jgi:uncharacterized protein YjbI with pentapeptide repeats